MTKNYPSDLYTSPERREKLNQLIDQHGEDTICKVMDWSTETLSSYSHNGARDVSEQKLELLEMKLDKLDKAG